MTWEKPEFTQEMLWEDFYRAWVCRHRFILSLMAVLFALGFNALLLGLKGQPNQVLAEYRVIGGLMIMICALFYAHRDILLQLQVARFIDLTADQREHIMTLTQGFYSYPFAWVVYNLFKDGKTEEGDNV